MLGSKSEPVLTGAAAIASWQIALGGVVVLLVFLRSRHFPAALMLLAGEILLGLPAMVASFIHSSLGQRRSSFCARAWRG